MKIALFAILLSAAVSAQAGESGVMISMTTGANTGPNPGQTMETVQVQERYISHAHHYLEMIARYPSGREVSMQRPEGRVSVRFEIDRNGGLREAHIDQTSHSAILDRAALATIRRGKYAAFPADLFRGEASRQFSVVMAYAAH